MIKITAFGASSSSRSINQRFAAFAATQFPGAETELLDLNDYEMPLYSSDRERASGVPAEAKAFYEKLRGADLILIALAEHNGTYTAAFKNIFDWASRHEANVFAGKPVLLLATSPGARGGIGVLEAARIRFPFHGARIAGHFSLPRFNDNFHPELGITDPELRSAFDAVIAGTREQVNASVVTA